MYLLERVDDLAAREPGRVYAEDVGGRSLTYGELRTGIVRLSRRLEGLGIRAGSRVVNMTPVSIENLVLWFSIGNLGALEFAVNPELRGDLLADQLRDVEADAVLCAADAVDDVRSALGSVRVVGVGPGATAGAPELEGADVPEPPAGDTGDDGSSLRRVAPWDVASVMFTSGTTGRSKGVVVPWHQIHEVSLHSLPMSELAADDAFYAPFALHHVTGKSACYSAAHLGGRVVIRPRFSVSEYWNDIERHGCTATVMMGAMAAMLGGAARPPSSPLRHVLVAPLVDAAFEMAEELDFRVCTVFNMTEVSSPITSQGWLTDRREGCGRQRPGFQCRVVDEHDRGVPDGTPGELVVRSDEPWTMFTRYWGNEAATATATRNLWFHTGDLVVRDPDGWFFFKDRLKDSIRRRGENISSMELESMVLAQPGIEEVAAYGVPSELGEEDVMVAVVVDEASFEGLDRLHEALSSVLLRHMVPRYYRIVSALPKTPTEKVLKRQLRDEGTAGSAFDAGEQRPKAEAGRVSGPVTRDQEVQS